MKFIIMQKVQFILTRIVVTVGVEEVKLMSHSSLQIFAWGKFKWQNFDELLKGSLPSNFWATYVTTISYLIIIHSHK